MNEVENDDPTKQPVLEVQGIFPDSSALRAAIDGLKQAGYVHADAVLPEDQDGPRPGADDSAPTEENHQQMRILTTSLAGSAGAVLRHRGARQRGRDSARGWSGARRRPWFGGLDGAGWPRCRTEAD